MKIRLRKSNGKSEAGIRMSRHLVITRSLRSRDGLWTVQDDCAFVVTTLLAISLLFSCNTSQNERAIKQNETTYYTCPMHPEIHEDEPGDCPICGMPLVLKTDSLSQVAQQGDTSLPVDKRIIITSLPSIHPMKKNMQEKITAEGTIEYDTRHERNIATRYSGRIDKLYVKYMYQPVKYDEVLMEIYSPEMVTAQQNLIFLLSDPSTHQQLIGASKRKLLLLGMTERQIEQVTKTKQPLTLLSVYSPYEGHVHEATIMNGTVSESSMSTSNMDELSLKEGMYVHKGQTVFNLLDPHMVWAVVQIYADDAQKIKVNDKVELTVEGTGKNIQAQIGFIEPFYTANSKTLSVRVYLDNEDHVLKVGMYVRATISADSISGIWIPKSAMLDLGQRRIVFRRNEDGFEPYEIKTGIVSGDFIQVIEGLNEEDAIASDAQYIQDSESFITTK